MSAIAGCSPAAAGLIETNMGVSNDLQVLLPSAKYQLLYGRPADHTAEYATLELAAFCARGSGAFIDVGANEGMFVFYVANALERKRDADIHFFEPDPVLYERLVANLARNRIAAHGTMAAVGGSVGRAMFHRNLGDDLSGSLTTAFTHTHATVAVETDVTTLAQHMTAHAVRRACVKVDVEGAAISVWEGARGALDRIDWLICEILGDELKGQLPRRIIAESGWYGYYVRDFELVRSIDGEFEYRAPFYNWLFCPAGPVDLAGLLKGTRFRVLDPSNTVVGG